jgi:hypothetical protein
VAFFITDNTLPFIIKIVTQLTFYNGNFIAIYSKQMTFMELQISGPELSDATYVLNYIMSYKYESHICIFH